MRIAVDINGITARSGGLGAYLRILVAELAALDRENEYILYHHSWRGPNQKELQALLPRQPNFRLVCQRVPNVATLLAEYLAGLRLTELLLRRQAIDLYHGPANIVPRLQRIKSLVTIHHYVPVDHALFQSEGKSLRERFFFGVTEKAARGADHVVAVSEATRRDLIDALGLPEDKVTVIYPGGPPPAYARVEGRGLPPALASRLPARYVLFSGPLNARKNLPALLEAFAAVKDKLNGCGIAITSNPSDSYRETICSLAERLGLARRIVFLGELSDDEMALLYRNAECLAYVSLMEGFGTPPLEAMASGCPVIASAVGALPETAGDAALLVSPADRGAIARALLRLATDPALRGELIAKGRQHVKRYSWRKMTRETIELYRRLAP